MKATAHDMFWQLIEEHGCSAQYALTAIVNRLSECDMKYFLEAIAYNIGADIDYERATITYND